MSHGILEHDSLMSVREQPWHGLGAILDDHPKNIDEAIEAAGLDWEVRQQPLYISDEDFSVVKEVEGYIANVRIDTSEALGIVTKRYKTVANREAFSFLSSIFGTEMLFETAGSLMNGRRVWVMMKLPSWIEIGGDAVDQYAFVSNSHDGKSSVLLAVTPIRIVCRNTLTAGISRAIRTYTIRHLGNPTKKIQEARQALEVTVNYYEQFKQYGDRLALAHMTDRAAKKLTNILIPMPEDIGDRAARNREEARESIMHLYKVGTVVNGISTRSENAPESYWGWYNAATEYADWYRGERKAGGRFQRAIDDPDGLKQRAWEIAVEYAGIR